MLVVRFGSGWGVRSLHLWLAAETIPLRVRPTAPVEPVALAERGALGAKEVCPMEPRVQRAVGSRASVVPILTCPIATTPTQRRSVGKGTFKGFAGRVPPNARRNAPRCVDATARSI